MRGLQNVPVPTSPPTWAEGSGGHHAAGPAVTWRCPWAVAQQNSCSTPSAQAPGRSELRGPCRPSHPPRNGLLLASGARTGVPPGMVAGSVSPSGSMSSGHLRLPLPPRWATWPQEAGQPLSRLARRGWGAVRTGQDPQPGPARVAPGPPVERDGACRAREEGMAAAPSPWGGSLLPLGPACGGAQRC